MKNKYSEIELVGYQSEEVNPNEEDEYIHSDYLEYDSDWYFIYLLSALLNYKRSNKETQCVRYRTFNI